MRTILRDLGSQANAVDGGLNCGAMREAKTAGVLPAHWPAVCLLGLLTVVDDAAGASSVAWPLICRCFAKLLAVPAEPCVHQHWLCLQQHECAHARVCLCLCSASVYW